MVAWRVGLDILLPIFGVWLLFQLIELAAGGQGWLPASVPFLSPVGRIGALLPGVQPAEPAPCAAPGARRASCRRDAGPGAHALRHGCTPSRLPPPT
jgi:hypothetical protein